MRIPEEKQEVAHRVSLICACSLFQGPWEVMKQFGQLDVVIG